VAALSPLRAVPPLPARLGVVCLSVYVRVCVSLFVHDVYPMGRLVLSLFARPHNTDSSPRPLLRRLALRPRASPLLLKSRAD
jgi:hypothetical protein